MLLVEFMNEICPLELKIGLFLHSSLKICLFLHSSVLEYIRSFIFGTAHYIILLVLLINFLTECLNLFTLFNFRFNLTDKEGVADRKVPVQPLVFYSKDGKVSRYNLRKVRNKLRYYSVIQLTKFTTNE